MDLPVERKLLLLLVARERLIKLEIDARELIRDLRAGGCGPKPTCCTGVRPASGPPGMTETTCCAGNPLLPRRTLITRPGPLP